MLFDQQHLCNLKQSDGSMDAIVRDNSCRLPVFSSLSSSMLDQSAQ
jgi:hypothetical protein